MIRILIALLVTGGVVVAMVTRATADSSPDHYLLYKVRSSESDQVELRTQFTDPYRDFKVGRLKRLAVPAEKTVGGYVSPIVHPDIHLTAYKLKFKNKRPRQPRVNVSVTDQFGTLEMQVRDPSRLLVPAEKAISSPPSISPPESPTVDHFVCYKVRLRSDFDDFEVILEDQFTTKPKLFEVDEPEMLCAPADKKHDGTFLADDKEGTHLLCYEVELEDDDDDDDGSRLRRLWTADQFDPLRRINRPKTEEPKELCVPATKTVL